MARKTNNTAANKNQTDFSKVAATVEPTLLEVEVEKSFLSYSYMVILSRAISDARDGMKPVHRRILWSMFEDGYLPEKNHVKSAKIVGAVTGNYHTFGDAACYGAMVRLAQAHSLMVPLIDPHGNMGNAPGEQPAAPRYTEARLNKAAIQLLAEIKEDSVHMKPNYDSSRVEPEVLPVRFPNLVINGGSGIAVGLATNIPPANPDEVMAATRWLLTHPNATLERLMEFMPGPDFPTGGEILGVDAIKKAYETGRGIIRIRARYVIESLPRGKSNIIFTELPYETSTETIIEGIKKGAFSGTIQGIADVKDLSDRKNGTRLVVETKAGFNNDAIVASLLKHTNLEISFGINNTVILDGEPVTVGLKTLLETFINFRKKTVTQRTQNRLDKRNDRLHLLEGLLKALANIDEVIRIVRNAADTEVAQTGLMKKFKIDAEQADYVLSIPLRRLTKFDTIQLQDEEKKLKAEAKELNKILTDEKTLIQVIAKELDETAKIISTERRSTIIGGTLAEHQAAAKEVVAQAEQALVVADEPCFVAITPKGNIIRSSAAPKKPVRSIVETTTRGRFIAVTNTGRGFKVNTLHVNEKESKPENVLPAPLNKNEKVIAVVPMELQEGKTGGIAIGTRKGVVKITAPQWPKTMDEFVVITLDKDDVIVEAAWVDDVSATDFVFIGSDSSFLTFPADKVRPSGLTAGGVAGLALKNNHVVSFNVVDRARRNEYVVVETTGKSIKATPFLETLYPSKGRATGGYSTFSFVKGETEIVNATVSWKGVMFTQQGQVVPLPVLNPKRVASGTKLGPDNLF